MSTSVQSIPAVRERIISLDEFRGYTVAGMLLVNFLGSYKATIPAVLRHHNTYCSYADTIMPQFFFAVGFAFRLTLLRRLRSIGAASAYWAVLKRNAGLILLGLIVYHLDGKVQNWDELQRLGFQGFVTQAFRREPFQTLVHIALASLWIAPVIASRPIIRVSFLILTSALHLYLSAMFYFDWAWTLPVIDGGPLGFMSWAIPTLLGSLAYDIVVAAGPAIMLRLFGWSLVFMAIGYLMTGFDGSWDALPFRQAVEGSAVTMWTMSQRTGSVSYMTFSAGFSLALYGLFVLLCDMGTVRVGLFRTFGQNALIAYILHGMVAGAVKPYVPSDSPAWFFAVGFSIYFGVCYLFIRHLEKHRLFLRL